MNVARNVNLSQALGLRVQNQQQRGFATGKQIKNRMRSVKSIGKITKAMKMVAAAKLRAVQNSLNSSRAFASDLIDMIPAPDVVETEADKKNMIVAFTTDRGLCGGVNGQVIRDTRARVNATETNKPMLVIVGDKGKAALERLFSNQFTVTMSDIGKGTPSFRQVAAVTEHIVTQSFDRALLVYNRFNSAISYKLSAVPLPSLDAFAADPVFEKFEFEGDKDALLRNFYELRSAAMVYNFMVDSATSEESARMTAMDNSSKNAGEMLEKLTLQYNKSRQTKITTELNEIISGATSIQKVED